MVKKKSRPLRKIAKTSAFLLPLGLLAYVLFFTPIFKIQAVEIEGEGATEEEINKYLGEGTVGANILFWQPARLVQEEEGDITKKLAYFKLDKSILKRTIIVNIEDRERKLIWCYKEVESCFWVDKDGILFEASPTPSGNLIPSIEEASKTVPDIGTRVISEDLWVNLVRILGILDELKLPVEKAAIDNIKYRELIVYSVDGPKIIFGLDISPEFTKTALSSLRSSGNISSWGKIATINLTVEGRAYTTQR